MSNSLLKVPVNLQRIEELTARKIYPIKPSGRKPQGSGDTPRSVQGFIELENEEEARRRLQAVSREERVLNELERIAFGGGPVAGKLKAMELLIKHIGIFDPKREVEVDRTSEEILTEITKKIEQLNHIRLTC